MCSPSGGWADTQVCPYNLNRQKVTTQHRRSPFPETSLSWRQARVQGNPLVRSGQVGKWEKSMMNQGCPQGQPWRFHFVNDRQECLSYKTPFIESGQSSLQSGLHRPGAGRSRCRSKPFSPHHPFHPRIPYDPPASELPQGGSSLNDRKGRRP